VGLMVVNSSIKVNGVELHYEIHGAGNPLVLIHGLGSSSRSWKYQVPEFSKYYRVITFDCRGHGDSEKPENPQDYSIDLYVQDLKDLLYELEIVHVRLCGLSTGGNIAMQFTLDYPDKVKSLILCSCVSEVNTSICILKPKKKNMTCIWVIP